MTRRERNQSRKGTKRALTSSVLAIALCVVLLAGATFAWFTDTASTKVSKIEAGTLKVDIVDSEGTSVQGKTLNFKTADNPTTDILWEPGATYELPEVQVVNKGNLALKYKVVFTAVEGDQSLAEALEIGTIETVQGEETFVSTQNTLADALKPTNPDGTDDTDGFAHGNLAANGATDLTTFALHMKEAAGNEYQGKSISGLTIAVLATQDTVEKDSKDNTYDAKAEYPAEKVTAVNALPTSASTNAYIVLTEDITGSAQSDSVYSGTKAGFVLNGGTLDGKGSSITVDGTDYGIQTSGGTIKNVTITNAYRGIVVNAPTENVYIDNVTTTNCGYGINTAEHSEGAAKNLYVTNSTISGWSSWAGGLESVNFTKCCFGTSTYYSQDMFKHGLNPYVTTTFDSCSFDNGYYIFTSDLADNATVTFTNCTCNGEKLTADNVLTYLKLHDASDNQISNINELAGKVIFN